MKIEDAERMLRRQGYWYEDIPTGRLSIDYIFAKDQWRASYRGFSDDSHLIANFDHDLIGALRWTEQVEEVVSHEGKRGFEEK